MERTTSEQIAWLMGQVSVLGMAVQASITHHPNRGAVAETIHENFENIFSRTLARPFQDSFLDGMKSARDLYLLKQQDDPGQPSKGL